MVAKTVFVTVGTTEFDQLIKTVSSDEICKLLRSQGYSKLLLQTGRGQYQPQSSPLTDETPAVQSYDFKDSIADDMAKADLVICHAGAGSVLESLTAGKATLVVINDGLMDNHQRELAAQLQKLSYLYYCTCRTLKQTLEESDLSALQPYIPGKPHLLGAHLLSLGRSPSSPPSSSSSLSSPSSSLSSLSSSSVSHMMRTFIFHLGWVGVLGVVYLVSPLMALFLLLVLVCVCALVFCGKVEQVKLKND